LKKIRQLLSKLGEIRLLPRLTVNIWFFPVALCSYLGNYSSIFFSTFLIAAIHELSHILCAKLLGVKISHVTIFPFGVAAVLSGEYIRNSAKEFAIAFCGPFINLVLFWILHFLSQVSNSTVINYCADVNLAMCAVNLVPTLPLDGGRMLKSILTSKYGIIRAYNLTLSLSRILVVILSLFAIVLFIISGFNFSLVLITVFLFQNLSREQRSVSHIALKEILENNTKIREREAFPVKNFCVNADTRISVILRLLSYDYFCIFHILDSNSEIIKCITETELLTTLTNKGIRTKFSEI